MSALPRHWLLLLAAALAVASSAMAASEPLSSFHGRMAAEWAWSAASSSSDDETCWGHPDECPVVYDLDAADGDAGAAGVGRRRLQYYYDVNTAVTTFPTRYISYSVLTRDAVPCSVPGQSYYNCEPGAEANPYSRGCSAITQCRD